MQNRVWRTPRTYSDIQCTSSVRDIFCFRNVMREPQIHAKFGRNPTLLPRAAPSRPRQGARPVVTVGVSTGLRTVRAGPVDNLPGDTSGTFELIRSLHSRPSRGIDRTRRTTKTPWATVRTRRRLVVPPSAAAICSHPRRISDGRGEAQCSSDFEGCNRDLAGLLLLRLADRSSRAEKG